MSLRVRRNPSPSTSLLQRDFSPPSHSHYVIIVIASSPSLSLYTPTPSLPPSLSFFVSIFVVSLLPLDLLCRYTVSLSRPVVLWGSVRVPHTTTSGLLSGPRTDTTQDGNSLTVRDPSPTPPDRRLEVLFTSTGIRNYLSY